MYDLAPLRLCLTFLLGLFLLGPQVFAGPLEVTKQLNKRGVLEDLYATVKDPDKVNTGTAKSWELYPKKGDKAAVLAPTEFYGCTLVVIANGHGVLIGHFAEEKPGNVQCMQDAASVQSMIQKLEDAEAGVDIDLGVAHAWIIYSDDVPSSSPGYKAIYNNLNSADRMNIPAGNIMDVKYRRGGGGGTSDKLVVQWQPKSDNTGATLNVYIRSDTAAFTATYDCNANPVTGGSRLMARVGPACTPASSSTPAAPAPASYATGWCGMHVVQYQKNEQGIPNHPANPEYVLDVSLFDAAQKPIPLKNCNGCGTTASAVTLNGKFNYLESNLPFGMMYTVGAKDDDAILFKYGDQSWGSNDQEHHSNFGGYENGKREGDTGFSC